MKSVSNPKSSVLSRRPRSYLVWLTAASVLFPSVACSDAGLDVGNDSRGVNSHEDEATDESSSESSAGEGEDTPTEMAAPEGSVEEEPADPGPNVNPVNPTSPVTMTSPEPGPIPTYMAGPGVPGMLPFPQPAPTSLGAMCDAGLVLCAAECVDISSDPLNCGACGIACMSETCEQGICGGTEPNPNPVSGVCGDGLLDMASESCDDGNAVSNDGCSAMCTLEEAFVCPNSGEPCESVCGNGIVEQEACDDGNVEPGDGCDNSCAIEQGFSCSVAGGIAMMNPDGGTPMPDSPLSECQPVCGDGIVAGDEECDSGMAPNETCSADCTLPI